jgi:uncharacterized membrane protein
MSGIPQLQSGSTPSQASRRAKPRDASFDFLKGFLVLVMVVHHTLEYFVGPDFWLIRYVDFVTGGFVFAAGFLPAALFQSNPVIDRQKTCGRLFKRGLKLLLFFIFLNIILGLVLDKSPSGKQFGVTQFLGNLRPILLAGDKSLAAFAILVPIAYTLMALAILLQARHLRFVVITTALGFVTFCTLSSSWSFNLYYLSMGLAGSAAGISVDARLMGPCLPRSAMVLLWLGAAAYMISISFLQHDNAVLYAAGIFCVLGCVYTSIKAFESERSWFGFGVVLGQYSLVGYLSQILFLQILRRSHVSVLHWSLGLIPFLLTCAFVGGLCFGLDFLRKENRRIDFLYRLVFA